MALRIARDISGCFSNRHYLSVLVTCVRCEYIDISSVSTMARFRYIARNFWVKWASLNIQPWSYIWVPQAWEKREMAKRPWNKAASWWRHASFTASIRIMRRWDEIWGCRCYQRKQCQTITLSVAPNHQPSLIWPPLFIIITFQSQYKREINMSVNSYYGNIYFRTSPSSSCRRRSVAPIVFEDDISRMSIGKIPSSWYGAAWEYSNRPPGSCKWRRRRGTGA